jgi:hypothetical protein
MSRMLISAVETFLAHSDLHVLYSMYFNTFLFFEGKQCEQFIYCLRFLYSKRRAILHLKNQKRKIKSKKEDKAKEGGSLQPCQ